MIDKSHNNDPAAVIDLCDKHFGSKHYQVRTGYDRRFGYSVEVISGGAMCFRALGMDSLSSACKDVCNQIGGTEPSPPRVVNQ